MPATCKWQYHLNTQDPDIASYGCEPSSLGDANEADYTFYNNSYLSKSLSGQLPGYFAALNSNSNDDVAKKNIYELLIALGGVNTSYSYAQGLVPDYAVFGLGGVCDPGGRLICDDNGANCRNIDLSQTDKCLCTNALAMGENYQLDASNVLKGSGEYTFYSPSALYSSACKVIPYNQIFDTQSVLYTPTRLDGSYCVANFNMNSADSKWQNTNIQNQCVLKAGDQSKVINKDKDVRDNADIKPPGGDPPKDPLTPPKDPPKDDEDKTKTTTAASTATPATSSSSASLYIILFVILAVLSGGGYYLYTKKSKLKAAK